MLYIFSLPVLIHFFSPKNNSSIIIFYCFLICLPDRRFKNTQEIGHEIPSECRIPWELDLVCNLFIVGPTKQMRLQPCVRPILFCRHLNFIFRTLSRKTSARGSSSQTNKYNKTSICQLKHLMGSRCLKANL